MIGLLSPSGGAYPANGVVVWDPTAQYSAEAVCTFPAEQHRSDCGAQRLSGSLPYSAYRRDIRCGAEGDSSPPTVGTTPLLSIPSAHGSSGYFGRFPTTIAFQRGRLEHCRQALLVRLGSK